MRNTYDHKGPQSRQNPTHHSQSEHTEAYTTGKNPKNYVSYQKNNNQGSSNEKMTKYILDTLKKISMNGTRYSISTALKPNQKTLITTISNLLRSFDNSFEESHLTVDMIIEVYKMLGYQGNINKTFFQPVGAPHTWTHCLSMMEWLAELASFHFDLRAHIEEEGGSNEEDFNTLLIKSQLENQSELPQKYLDKEIQKKSKLVEDYLYTIKTKELAAENLLETQKDINLLEEDEKRHQSQFLREKQEVIQVDRENSQLLQDLEQIIDGIKNQEYLRLRNEKQIQDLQSEISSQELSVEEVEKIKLAIRQFHEKILQLKRNHSKEVESIERTNKHLADEYSDFYGFLEDFKLVLGRHQAEIERRNIYADFPECDINAFIDFLRDNDQQSSHIKIQSILGLRQIRQIAYNGEHLIKILDSEIKVQNDEHESLVEELRILNERVLSKQKEERERNKEENEKRSYFDHVEDEGLEFGHKLSALKSENENVEQEIAKEYKEFDSKMSENQAMLEEIKSLKEMKGKFSQKMTQVLQHMEKSQQDFEYSVIQLMEEHYEQYEQFNGAINFQQISKGSSQNIQ